MEERMVVSTRCAGGRATDGEAVGVRSSSSMGAEEGTGVEVMSVGLEAVGGLAEQVRFRDLLLMLADLLLTWEAVCVAV